MKKFSYLTAICCLFLLMGCQEAPTAEIAEATELPDVVATDTAVSPTNTAPPTETATNTAVPTATETNTPTPEPTATPTETPTAEPTATNTPTATATATDAPATATTAPPAPVSAPPPAPAPAGPNLLANPGFEIAATGWTNFSYHTVDSQPNFVHSGQRSLQGGGKVWQQVTTNIQAGTTYRAGGWFKVWSSTGEDRTISENPSDLRGRICLNTFGDDAIELPTTICSGWIRPLDVWQFISIDAVATNDRVTVILQVALFNNDNNAIHSSTMWDDISLGLAPASATATPAPAPAAEPVRPNPIPFSPTALRDSMTSVRWTIEQAGGLLDRLYNGENQTCTEFQGYYDDAIRSATYSGVADDWAGLYNDYIFAVENFLATNENINALCDGGGGGLSELNYGAARSGINASLDRLIPAIEAANAKLGG